MSNDNFRLMASMSDFSYSDNLTYRKNMLDRYYSKIDQKFDQSTSIRTIKEEYPYGSGIFRDLTCRIVSVRTVGTGSKMSDSYKTLIFKSQDYKKSVGYLYQFEDNYWIACNSDIMSSPTDSIVVRRCNNIMRWKDANGVIRSVPISFEEDAFYLNNQDKKEIDRLGGYRRAIIQRTDLTKTIIPNQRFIFGNQCLKLSGSGVNSFLNQHTEDDNSPSIIRLNFQYDYINESVDDMINKIANAFSNNYSIKIDQTNTTYSASSNEYVFTATVLDNGKEVEFDLDWNISGINLYSYSVIDNRLNVNLDSIGSCTINVCSKNNVNLKTSLDISVVDLDTYLIKCEPIIEILYKDDVQNLVLNLYKNGQLIDDAVFYFEKIDLLSSDYYTYVKNGNEIELTNKKMSSEKINIKCTVLNYPDSGEYNISIKLGGAW